MVAPSSVNLGFTKSTAREVAFSASSVGGRPSKNKVEKSGKFSADTIVVSKNQRASLKHHESTTNSPLNGTPFSWHPPQKVPVNRGVPPPHHA
jgi:hypothetical protein